MTNEDQPTAASIREAAHALIRAAVPVLAALRLYPRPRSNPFVAVGEDYAGSDLAVPEFAALEHAIAEAHQRFRGSTPLMQRDFANLYAYSFVEACVTRLTFADDPWSIDGPAVEQSVDELVAQVLTRESEVACCRVVLTSRRSTERHTDSVTLMSCRWSNSQPITGARFGRRSRQ